MSGITVVLAEDPDWCVIGEVQTEGASDAYWRIQLFDGDTPIGSGNISVT